MRGNPISITRIRRWAHSTYNVTKLDSASEIMEVTCKGKLPLDPTGFPNINHLDSITAPQRYGFCPSRISSPMLKTATTVSCLQRPPSSKWPIICLPSVENNGRLNSGNFWENWNSSICPPIPSTCCLPSTKLICPERRIPQDGDEAPGVILLSKIVFRTRKCSIRTFFAMI